MPRKRHSVPHKITAMSRFQTYSKVLEHLYQGVTDTHKWEAAVELIRQLSGAAACKIQIRRNLGEQPRIVLANVDPSWSEAYLNYYFEKDPWVKAVFRKGIEKTGGFFHGEELVSNKHFLRSEFYNDFLKPQNHRYLVTSISAGGSLTAISLLYSARRTLSEQGLKETETVLSSLSSHLYSADRLSRELIRAEHKALSYEATLEYLPISVILVDGDLRIHRLNQAGEKLLKTLSSIKNKAGYLTGYASQMHKLHELVTRTAQNNLNPVIEPSPVERMVLPEDGITLEIAVIPAGNGAAWLPYVDNRLVFLFITATQAAPTTTVARICRGYGLSRSETKFAHAFVQHCDLMKTAEALFISLNTAKTHLKHIFAKTGCKKQTELLKLLLSGTTPRTNKDS